MFLGQSQWLNYLLGRRRVISPQESVDYAIPKAYFLNPIHSNANLLAFFSLKKLLFGVGRRGFCEGTLHAQVLSLFILYASEAHSNDFS